MMLSRVAVLNLIRSLVSAEAVPLSFAERERLVREILNEIFGLGPLELLLNDPAISDILVIPGGAESGFGFSKNLRDAPCQLGRFLFSTSHIVWSAAGLQRDLLSNSSNPWRVIIVGGVPPRR